MSNLEEQKLIRATDGARGITDEHTTMKDYAKLLVDGLSVSTVVATIVGWLPALAALASLIWTCIRIYETKTVQGWMGRESK